MNAYLIGTDEAGYGPNLGPLVISATLWELPEGVSGDELPRLLQSVVAPAVERPANGRPPRLAIADSKRLYKSRGSLRHIERGVLAALGLLGNRPSTWRELWAALVADAPTCHAGIPWYAQFDVPLPQAADRAELDALLPWLNRGMATAGVRLLAVRSRALFPRQFNDGLDQHGNKSSLLSYHTLQLAAELTEQVDAGPITIVCDKHGGRNRYAELLKQHFPESLIEIHGESRELSLYRCGPAERRLEFRFQCQAEAWLPVALASMVSKYLRESAMQALNTWWSARVPGLRPTAGYPVDARRFQADIATQQRELEIAENMLWRRL